MPALSSRPLAALPLAAALVLTGALSAHASTVANEVVYTTTDANGDAGIVLRDLETRRQTVVLPATPATSYDTPELSPNGDRVVAAYDTATSTAETLGLTVVSRTGTGRQNLTALDFDATGSFDVEPTFSPDGLTVLFTRVTTMGANATFALWTVPAAGGSASAVPGGDAGFGGTYDPTDPTRIVFTKVTDPETGDGELTSLTGGVTTSLGVQGRYPKVSPDGSSIAYTRPVSAGSDRLATIPSGGGTETVFPAAVTGEAFAAVTAWSPDGESILFDLASSSGFALWAVDRRGLRAGVVVPATATTDASGGHVQGPAPAAVQPASAASTFVPVTPTRLLDTRTTNGGHPGKLGADQGLVLQVEGRTLNGGGTVTGAVAAVLNVTVVDGTAPTVVKAYAAPVSPAPGTSSLNTVLAGQVRANQVTVTLPDPMSADAGKVALRNGSGQVHLVADLTGYYVSGTAAQRLAPLAPRRILDTRTGLGAPQAPIGPRGVVDLDVVGLSDVPANATAVVLNVTGTAPTTTTNLKVFPTPASGSAVPLVSSLNLVAGQTAPNLVTVAIGSGGRVRVSNAAGSVHVVADLAGYYAPDAPGGYVPVLPLRFLDTRSGTGAAPIVTTAGAFTDVRVRGVRGVPDDALAVSLNLTGTRPSSATVLRAYPATTATPTVSNLNLVAGDSRANAVLVVPGTDGRVRVLNGAGTVHLVADLTGYFVPLP